MKLKTLTRPFEIKAVEEDGTFTGYGSVFNVLDSYREIVLPGAFEKTLADHDEAGTAPLMLWQHNPDEPIGVWQEIKEDDHGLLMKGKFVMEVQRAREAYALMKAKAIRGLSIGFSVPKGGSEFNDKKNITELSRIKLWETSPVSFAANPEAFVTEVRSALEAGCYPSKREFEKLMQDAGFSRKDARLIMAKGFDALLLHDADDAAGTELLTETLRRITS